MEIIKFIQAYMMEVCCLRRKAERSLISSSEMSICAARLRRAFLAAGTWWPRLRTSTKNWLAYSSPSLSLFFCLFESLQQSEFTLPQIEILFSDKTGTLTRNHMTFRCCSIRGSVFSAESRCFKVSSRHSRF